MSRKLRVKLITIPWELEVPTLTLASLAAVTPEDRFEVCLVDLLRERLVLDEPVDLVGISASTPRIKAAYALADLYRDRGVKVVLGGHHATALPDEALEHADAVVCGEGETSWMRICDQLLTNPATVAGIYDDPPPDLARLPLPRVDLMRLDRYQSFYFPVIASRGCPEACSFCFSKRMTRGYRTYPIRHVLQQIRARPARVRGMYFVDDNLAGDADFARELFRELAKGDRVPFGMQVRNEFCLDPENLRLAHEAGCALITSGFESLNQTTLDRTGKGASAARYEEIVEAIQAEGMIASGNFMFGFDWDGPDIFERTWEFLRDSRIYHSTFTTEIPFPGTATYRRYRREGRILSEDYDDYIGKDKVVVRPLGMTPEQLRSGMRWLSSQYYSVRHRHGLYRHAYQNGRLFPQLQGWARRPALLSLNYFQWFLYNYRMVPSLRWLYDRLVPLNKYRFVGDLPRRTNFWTRSFEPAAPADAPLDASESRSPFYERSGTMRPGKQKLVV